MPSPCRYPTMPYTKGLDCVFPIWFTQCGRVRITHTMPYPYHSSVMPRPYHSESDLSRPQHSAAWERHGNGMVCVSAVQRRRVVDLPAFGFFRLPRGVRRRLFKKQTSCSDISVYHADFHERHGTVGEWQGRSISCVNKRGRERHDMCELDFSLLLQLMAACHEIDEVSTYKTEDLETESLS
jgi:hypothetical protein